MYSCTHYHLNKHDIYQLKKMKREKNKKKLEKKKIKDLYPITLN